jgi:3-phenylpropionate/cinnamic acid dioxygenase small subunit
MNTTTWSDLREVELFLFREAELADQNEYTAWSALWTEQLTYWGVRQCTLRSGRGAQ